MRGGLPLLAVATWALILSAAVGETRPRVTDQASALFESTVDDLEAELAGIAADTGVEVFVVVLRDLDGRSAREAALAEPVWDRPGDQVVLLVAMAERQVRIQASPALGARTPDAAWSRLIETRMLPDLRAGRQGTAIRRGVAAIGERLSGEAPAPGAQIPAGDPQALRDMMFVLFAGLLAALSFNRIRHGRIVRGRW